MASLSGNYQETNIATIAAAITLLNAHLTVENARMIALGGAATHITGSITLSIKAEDGAGNSVIHRITVSLDCPALADTATLTAALSVFATAVETESSYTTVVEVSTTLHVTMTN